MLFSLLSDPWYLDDVFIWHHIIDTHLLSTIISCVTVLVYLAQTKEYLLLARWRDSAYIALLFLHRSFQKVSSRSPSGTCRGNLLVPSCEDSNAIQVQLQVLEFHVFDPTFVKLHLQRSLRDTPILFTLVNYSHIHLPDFLHCCPVECLLEEPPFTVDESSTTSNLLGTAMDWSVWD